MESPREGPRKDIAFLTRSATRVAVLDRIRQSPRTREELLAVADASRVTLDRLLGEFESRTWIDRTEAGYEATGHGALVGGEVARLRADVRRSRRTHLGSGGKAVPEPTAGGTGPPRTEAGSEPESRSHAIDAGDLPVHEGPLADIAFIARSGARPPVLEALADGPATREELKTVVDASRSTLGRVLGEFEERGWIDRTTNHCEATALGRKIADAFSRTLSNLAAAESLSPVFGWLPVEEFDFELSRFDDASLVITDWDDPTKSIHHVASLVQEADHARIVGPGVTREVAEAVRTLTVERGGRFEGVVDDRALAAVRADDTLAETVGAIVESERASIASHDDGLSLLVVVIIDDTTILCGSEGEGPAHQAVESGDDAVRGWAESYFESARDEAEPLDIAAFTP